MPSVTRLRHTWPHPASPKKLLQDYGNNTDPLAFPQSPVAKRDLVQLSLVCVAATAGQLATVHLASCQPARGQIRAKLTLAATTTTAITTTTTHPFASRQSDSLYTGNFMF